MRLRTVIVEDHRLIRDLLRKVCTLQCGCRVVGETGRGRSAKRLIAATRPRLLILGVHLPDGDGFDVAEYTRTRWPAVRVLVLSSHCDDYTLAQVERSGVQGFLDKNTQSIKFLEQAIRALGKGRTWYSRAYKEAKSARASDSANFTRHLTERERTVLTLIGSSMSDREIARRLGITPSTAQTHRSHILRKLRIVNSLKLVKYAIEHGFTRITAQRDGKPVLP